MLDQVQHVSGTNESDKNNRLFEVHMIPTSMQIYLQCDDTKPLEQLSVTKVITSNEAVWSTRTLLILITFSPNSVKPSILIGFLPTGILDVDVSAC